MKEKERKEKERKGNERKGKKRKGKEREGISYASPLTPTPYGGYSLGLRDDDKDPLGKWWVVANIPPPPCPSPSLIRW